MFTINTRNFSKFASSDRGSVTIIFGLMSLAMMFLVGMAVDYSRAVDARGRIAAAADSAVLAAGRALMSGQSIAQVKDVALKFFEENVKPVAEIADIGLPVIDINEKTGAVKIDVPANVEMKITRIAGFKKMDIPVATEAIFSTRDIEIGMALDITGSMCPKDSRGNFMQPCTSGPKINGLKNAFETFANRLMPTDPDSVQKVRIAVAPYSQSVNLGSYASRVGGYTSGNNWVTERNGGGYSDNTGAFYFGRPGDRDVDSTEGAADFNNAYRPMSPVIPLSDDKDALVSAVQALEARGGTAGHLGIQWAWNLVSEKWGTTFSSKAPASYDDVAEGKLIKAVVIMTDGVFNTAYHGNKSSQQAIALCSAMKTKGVTVFTVGFGIDDISPSSMRDTAFNTLQSCATPGDGYFANASNAEELERAFENFASKLSELRLTK